MITEDQKQLKAAWNHLPVWCPECGRGDFTSTYSDERKHKLDCRVKLYIAKKVLWESYDANT